jgi:hypothetical protein
MTMYMTNTDAADELELHFTKNAVDQDPCGARVDR